MWGNAEEGEKWVEDQSRIQNYENYSHRFLNELTQQNVQLNQFICYEPSVQKFSEDQN